MERYGEQDDWTIEDINNRTIELAKIMYFQNKIPVEVTAEAAAAATVLKTVAVEV